jgi:prepilin-type N-terminal cleavage/methylation domain-containing protein
MKFFKKTGFTMIEILVAVAIIGLLSIVISQSIFVSVRSNVKLENMKDLKQNGDYAVGFITRLIQNAKAVNQCDSQLGLLNFDGTVTWVYTLFNRVIYQIQNGTNYGDPQYITADNLMVPGIAYTCTKIGGIFRTVKFSFTISELNSNSQVNYDAPTMPFTTTVNLRNINF